MKILFIGGTGTISSAITRKIAGEGNDELFLLNRGNRKSEFEQNIRHIEADINDEKAVREKLKDMSFIPSTIRRNIHR